MCFSNISVFIFDIFFVNYLDVIKHCQNYQERKIIRILINESE